MPSLAIRSYPKKLIALIGILLFPPWLYAEMALDAQDWLVAGALNAGSTIEGKTATFTMPNVGPYQIHFEPDGGFFMLGQGMALGGRWTGGNGRFSVQLDPTAITQLLATVEQDFLARTRIKLQANPTNVHLNGALRNDHAFEATLVIEASVSFFNHTTEPGTLSLTYRFSAAQTENGP